MSTLHRISVAVSLGLLLLGAGHRAAAESPSPLESEEEKTLYAIGLVLAQQLGALALAEDEIAVVQMGVADGALGREAKVDLQEYGPKVQAFAQARQGRQAEQEAEAGAELAAAEGAEPGAETTESGLVYTVLEAGDGASPGAADEVTVHYHGTLRDGSVFDSSVDRGEPATFRLDQVIPCWTEGVQKMQVGGKSRLLCPAGIAYGNEGRPPVIPGGATLIFEVELLGIGEAPDEADAEE